MRKKLMVIVIFSAFLAAMSQPPNIVYATESKSSIYFYMENKGVEEETVDSEENQERPEDDPTESTESSEEQENQHEKLPQTGAKTSQFAFWLGSFLLFVGFIIKKERRKTNEKN